MRILPLALLALAAGPLAQAADITVTFSEDFAEDLEDDYGLREGDYLSEAIVRDLNQELARMGIDVSRIDVTILNAKPTKPTFKQLGDEVSLDYGLSVSLGGMDLKATVFDADGTELTALEYDWFAHNIRDAGPTTWYDAKRASDRFARKLAKRLAAN